MLKGKEFGKAIAEAIKKKLELGEVRTKKAIADHFHIAPPSLSDWVNKGAISKEKLNELYRYFSDVVGYEHWGLTKGEWPVELSMTNAGARKAKPLAKIIPLDRRRIDRDEYIKQVVDLMISADAEGRRRCAAHVKWELENYKPAKKVSTKKNRAQPSST